MNLRGQQGATQQDESDVLFYSECESKKEQPNNNQPIQKKKTWDQNNQIPFIESISFSESIYIY